MIWIDLVILMLLAFGRCLLVVLCIPEGADSTEIDGSCSMSLADK